MYNKEQLERIRQLIELIENRKKEDNTHLPSYKDIKNLKELETYVYIDVNLLSHKSIRIEVLEYLIENYQYLGRFVLTYPLHNILLKEIVVMFNNNMASRDEIIDMAYDAIRDRNYYVDDECLDIKEILTEVLTENEFNTIYVKASKRTLNYDKIEMSKEYLDVIDEVERKIDENKTSSGRSSCYEIWSLKKEYLLAYNIIWHSPKELNENVMFD